MAEADTQTGDQCRALTDSGDRCSRPARDDGFCYQHDESDQTVSETDQQQQTDAEPSEAEQHSETDQGVETTDPADVDVDEDVDADEEIEAVLTVRRTVESTTGDLIGRPLSGVIEIEPAEGGWRGVVEVIERSSIPDTQDILGRYEIDLDEDGVVEGYRRLDRYRRDDTSPRELQ